MGDRRHKGSEPEHPTFTNRSFQNGVGRMLEDRRSAKAKPGRDQELKRTYDMSFSAAGENQVSDTDGSGKEDESNSPGETFEKVSTGC